MRHRWQVLQLRAVSKVGSALPPAAPEMCSGTSGGARMTCLPLPTAGPAGALPPPLADSNTPRRFVQAEIPSHAADPRSCPYPPPPGVHVPPTPSNTGAPPVPSRRRCPSPLTHPTRHHHSRRSYSRVLVHKQHGLDMSTQTDYCMCLRRCPPTTTHCRQREAQECGATLQPHAPRPAHRLS